MKAYENIDNIAAADPAELAERCGVSGAAAKAVRAAAKLALEDREAAQKRLNAGSRGGGRQTTAMPLNNTSDLAAEALAVEAAAEPGHSEQKS
jgi:DNA-binding MurR/RpiR family transcriptional regulator